MKTIKIEIEKSNNGVYYVGVTEIDKKRFSDPGVEGEYRVLEVTDNLKEAKEKALEYINDLNL